MLLKNWKIYGDLAWGQHGYEMVAGTGRPQKKQYGLNFGEFEEKIIGAIIFLFES